MTVIPLIIEPDADDPGCAQVMIDCTVAGLPRRFILDTGAARTQLSSGDGLELEPCGVERGSGGVFAAADHELAVAHDLRVGPVTVERLTVAVVPPRAQLIRDLLGMDVLGRFRWRLSLHEASLTLEPALADPLPNDLYVDPRGHPCLDLSWDQARAAACWDTGAGITVVDASYAANHPQLFAEGASSWGTDATGARQQTPTFLMAGPTIGDQPFDAHRVAVVDLAAVNTTLERPMDLILGFTTLSQADWVMDFPARRWSVTVLDRDARSDAASPRSSAGASGIGMA